MSKSSKSAQDNRANQLNPGHPAYYQSRGVAFVDAERLARLSQPALDNHANQLNPDDEAYAGSQDKSPVSQPSSDPSRTKSE